MRTLWRLISRLFSVAWRVINFIREFILNLFLLVLIIAGIGIWLQVSGGGSSSSAKTLTGGALKIDLNGSVVDQPSSQNRLGKIGRELLGSRSETLQQNSVFDIVDAIRQAKNDSKITGIVLDLRDFSGGDQPALRYIGKALQEFRESGKPVYAYGDNYSQAQYYLASFATTLYLSPQGAVDIHGMATNSLYYKSLLDTLKVSSHVFRVGTYKSAVEPYLRDDMSPAARDADSRWIGQLWDNYLDTVAANRKLTPQQVFPGADALITALKAVNGDTATYALNSRLVDGLESRAAVDQILTKKFGWDGQTKDYRNVSIYNYPLDSTQNSKPANIAVVVANGAIVDGESASGNVGSDTLVRQIRAARLNKHIKAIILRVNSPGGSVTASEAIREELMAAREAGKPIVVSMGGVAASGGYWISTPGNYIIASPTTLTGSIGIFGVINTIENSLSTIGVHTDGVSTSPLADVTMTKALPTQVEQMMQISIENGYRNFVSLVAQSRHKTPQQIDAIAQGHVWTGSDGKANGLVDQLGDFDDAINKAAQLAGVSQPQLEWYQEQPTFVDQVIDQMTGSVSVVLPASVKAFLPAPLAEVMTDLQKQPGLSAQTSDPQSRYAFCMNCGVMN
ncbi:signal peptide peptidase SppA [Tatumella saanichensis]|uniref:signal peptide peptidase SppA n=1 Tax=Tatumella saanichensis TaxID=480813 RepID=UPI0004A4171A|nr:signal peptide peptidase SppA [Tatumella saanichensis]